MFVVIIKRTSEQDGTGTWTQGASYVVKAQTIEGAEYKALYRWVQDSCHGSVPECLKVLGLAYIEIAIFSGDTHDQLVLVKLKRIAPCAEWRLGRKVNESPVHCAACDWYGPMSQMVHKYRLNSQQEIEPADFCPACGALLI